MLKLPINKFVICSQKLSVKSEADLFSPYDNDILIYSDIINSTFLIPLTALL